MLHETVAHNPFLQAEADGIRTGPLPYAAPDGRSFVGFLAQPAKPDGAAVLVAHNAPGVSDFERGVARRLARLGFVVLCADYVGGGEVLGMPEIHDRLGAAIADTVLLRPAMAAGFAALAAQPGVTSDRIAAIGYCLGGAAAIELARDGLPVGAVASFHGSLPVTQPEDHRRIRAPVLIQTGADDPMVPPEVRATFERQMNAAGVDWRMVLYGGVQHAFTVPHAADYGMPGLRYDQRADERSWQVMLDLLSASIGRPG